MAGTDLGDYVDPQGRFVQTCRLASSERLPLSVHFRRDRNSERAEVVFELGRIWNTEPINLDSYKVSIQRGSTVVYTTEVPRHFWFARWRWQSAPRNVTARISELTRSGLLPVYDARVNVGSAHPPKPHTYEIMGLADVAGHMGMTGDRGDIGPLTEPQAEYVCTERPSTLASLLAQAEAAGTVPWC